MATKRSKTLLFFVLGSLLGIALTFAGAILAYPVIRNLRSPARYGEKFLPSRIFNLSGNKNSVKKSKRVNTQDFFLSYENPNDLDILQPTEGVATEIVSDHATHGRQALLVNIPSGAKVSGLDWEVYGSQAQDWRGAQDFHFDLFNNTESAFDLEVKFKSGRDYPKQSFSHTVHLPAQQGTHVSIPTSDIARNCDLTQMSYVKIFANSNPEQIVFYLDNVGIRAPTDKDATAAVIAASPAVVTVDKPQKWLTAGFKLFVASSLDRIFQDGKTTLKPLFTDKAEVSLAANEYESFQVVVGNGKDKLTNVELEISELSNPATGQKFAPENIRWRVVGYVPTQKPYYPVKYVGNWPDPLLPGQKTDVPPGITQPFWVTVYAPAGTVPGDYSGTISLKADGISARQIPLKVRVYGFALPIESHLKTAFDFYGHITSKRYPRNPNESMETYVARIADLNDKFMVNMLKHRMSPVLNIDPKSPESLGQVDHYRNFGLNSFSVGKYGGTFNNNWPADDVAIDALEATYRSYGEILTSNKLLDMNYIYTWDEGEIGNPQVAKICAMVHKAYPKLKNMVCYHGFWDPEKNPDWGKDIDIWTFQIDNFNEKKMNRLRELGMEIWMYISGPSGSGSPNLAIDFDSLGYRVVPWLCWKYDIKGFLYWCVNWWPFTDPFKTAVNTQWQQNGNGLLFYPGKEGPVDSLRAEVFRDGMEDYEYFVLLKQGLEKLAATGLKPADETLYRKGQALLAVDKTIADSMFNFTKEQTILLKRRQDLAETIEAVNRIWSNTR